MAAPSAVSAQRESSGVSAAASATWSDPFAKLGSGMAEVEVIVADAAGDDGADDEVDE